MISSIFARRSYQSETSPTNWVLHFVPGDGPNALIEAISRTEEIQVKILTLYNIDQTLPDYCVKNHVSLESLKFSSKQLRRQYIALIRYLISKRPRVVFSHSFYPSLLCAAAAPLFPNTKFISVRHHNKVHILSNNKKAKLLDRFIASLSFHTIAVSEAVKTTMMIEGSKASKISVIYNGLPNPHQKYRKMNEDRKDQPFLLIALGRIDWQKNYEGMLESIARIRSNGLDIKLKVLGSGNDNYLNNLKELQATLGLKNVVEWLGRQSDIYPHLEEADLFIHAAVDEACPLVLIETMMYGIPIFSSNLGGCMDVLDGFYPGADPRDIDSFASYLSDCLQNLSELQNYALNISETVIDRFSDVKMQVEYTKYAISIL